MCEIVVSTFERLVEAPSPLQLLCKMYVSSHPSSCGDTEYVFFLHYSDFFFSPFQVG